ncbi:LicD family protein [Methanobrevibacter olleyae]|nr:LicD family protein [Methanobrevibacter olleyae]
MNTLQKNLYQLLVEFDEICNKYDIKYLLAAGASLGAVRNRSFMPWDDDIDLYITRENWNKLRHILETEDILPEGRSFIYKENTPYYCNPLPRYVDTTSTNIYISQAFTAKACGQHLELFIFDPMPKGEEAKEEYLKNLHIYTELLSPYFIVNKNTSLEDWQKHYELYKKYCHRVDKEGEEKVLKELEDKLTQYNHDECDQYIMHWGIKNYIYNKEHFEDGELGKFEESEFPIGHNTEGILRAAYGDSWMYVPVYEEQVSHNGLKNDIPFSEYTNRYLGKIKREKVFKKYKKNKRNNAAVFYNRRKVDMLVAKEKVIVESRHIIKKLEGKEEYLRELLKNKEYKILNDEFKEYLKLQSLGDVLKYNIKVPISDKNLATFLFSLIEQGQYYNVNKFLNLIKSQEKVLNEEFTKIEKICDICREISIARYDKKDEKLVESLINQYDDEYSYLLDIYRAKLWIKENNAQTIDDYKSIDKFCNDALILYPFDGEIMAIQAKAKLKSGQKEEGMELYKKSVHNTRNGLIWQKVEDECGYSRMDIERELIKELNGEE